MTDLARSAYNVLASHGLSLHQSMIARIIAGEDGWDDSTPMNRARAITLRRQVTGALRRNPDLFVEVDNEVWFLAGKSEGRTYPELD